MKLAKVTGRIGFGFGLLGPVLFYSSTYPFLYESHVVCPACPHIDIAYATKMTWIEVGLRLGLLCGLAFAQIGFGIGWSISKFRAPRDRHRMRQGRHSRSIPQAPPCGLCFLGKCLMSYDLKRNLGLKGTNGPSFDCDSARRVKFSTMRHMTRVVFWSRHTGTLPPK
jgi:hypothetical protein